MSLDVNSISMICIVDFMKADGLTRPLALTVLEGFLMFAFLHIRCLKANEV